MAPLPTASAPPSTPLPTPLPTPLSTPLHVHWRDEHLVVIHKPAGWLVHRTGLDAGETRFIVQTLRDQLGQPVWPVHRLDKGTCGLLVLALHAEAARALGAAFAGQVVHKRYLAIVRGWAPEAATVDHALRPDDAPADAAPQPALTEFRRLACFETPESSDPRFASSRASLVEARPLSGRRHQIRRHLKHLAHPILGDATHGKGPLNRWWAERLGRQRLWLHAAGLDLPHPVDGRPLAFGSGLDGDAAGLRLAPGLDAGLAEALAPWLAWNRLGDRPGAGPAGWVMPGRDDRVRAPGTPDC